MSNLQILDKKDIAELINIISNIKDPIEKNLESFKNGYKQNQLQACTALAQLLNINVFLLSNLDPQPKAAHHGSGDPHQRLRWPSDALFRNSGYHIGRVEKLLREEADLWACLEAESREGSHLLTITSRSFLLN